MSAEMTLAQAKKIEARGEQEDQEREQAQEVIRRDRALKAEQRRQERARAQNTKSIAEAESFRHVVVQMSDLIAPLSNDTLYRCGAGGVGAPGGPKLPSTTALPELLARAVAAAEKRLVRLREELAALQG